MLTVENVIEAVGAITIGFVEKEFKFTNITTDSRDITEGSLFVALKGDKFDGHDYCEKALIDGAAAVLVDNTFTKDLGDELVLRVHDTLKAYQKIAHKYRMLQKDLKVVAITGSNGKTSTKDLVAACLSEKYKVVKTFANFNNEIGLPKTLLEVKEDTQIVVVEMGMRGIGQIKELAKIAVPDVAVITNVGETHLELLGTIDNIAKAKSEILEELTVSNFAVLNNDDKYVRKMQTKAKTVTFAIDNSANYRAKALEIKDGKTYFTLETNLAENKKESLDKSKLVKETEIVLPLIGKHNVMNALAAIAVAKHFKVENSAIVNALSEASISGKRQEIIKVASVTCINDAYNASVASMQSAFEMLFEIKKSELEKGLKTRSIAVIADMLELGAVSRASHLKIVNMARETKVDLVLAYGDRMKVCVESAREKGLKAFHFASREKVSEYLKLNYKKNDIILFKGSNSMKVDLVIKEVFLDKK